MVRMRVCFRILDGRGRRDWALGTSHWGRGGRREERGKRRKDLERTESPHPGPLPSEWEREEDRRDGERRRHGGVESEASMEPRFGKDEEYSLTVVARYEKTRRWAGYFGLVILGLFGAAAFFACAAGFRFEHLEVFGDFGPVDEVPEGVDVVWASVLVVEVVGVFPDIEGEDWFVPEHDGGVLEIGRAHV